MKGIFSVIAGLLLLCATGAQAATVSFAPLSSTKTNGSTFTVDIIGQSFPTTEGGGVNLYYDKTIVNVLTVSIDDLVWDFLNDEGTIDNIAGSLTELWVAAWSDPGSDFTVATVEFQAVGLGTTSLTLTEYTGNPWASDGSPINPTFEGGSIMVTVIPEPTSILLIGSGLVGLLGVSRKKK